MNPNPVQARLKLLYSLRAMFIRASDRAPLGMSKDVLESAELAAWYMTTFGGPHLKASADKMLDAFYPKSISEYVQ